MRGTRLLRSPTAKVGAALVAALAAFAVVGPWAAPHAPNASDFVHGVSGAGTPVGPSSAFPLGADRIFRDELARLATGARLSLFIGVAATSIATAIGGAVGLLTGYFEGTLLDTVLMRLVDALLAFPFLLLVMAIGAALDHTTAGTILLTLGLTGWLGIARLVRAKTMQIRRLEYIEAARALGQSTARILIGHVLPNVAGPIVVLATLSVAHMIVAESVLSYLGVGVAPPTATWGQMLFEGQDYYMAAPWLFASPALAILLSVFGFNLLGEGLRDALDPR
jgi:ABC-type dipeptide/oligopeptide/nickel transport system permease subunit